MKTKTKPEVMKVRPLGDRVVIVRDDAETVTPGGVLLPDAAKEKTNRGTVVAVGPGKWLDGEMRAIIEVKSGDSVLFGSYSGNEVEHDGVKYLIMSVSEIIAVVSE